MGWVDLLDSANQKYDNGASGLAADNVQAAIDEIAAAGGGGEANLGANVGTGDAAVFRDKTGVTLNFKRLVEGANITLTDGVDTVTIAAAGASLANAEFPDSAHFASEAVADATVAFTDSNKQTVNASTSPNLTLTAPGVGNYLLKITNSGNLASISPTPRWDNATPPSWGGISILSLYYDGTNWYGSAIVEAA